MQVDNKLLDDLARVAAGAAGAVTGLRDEVEAQMRQRMERLLAHADVISRDEFEVVRELAANARREQEALAKTVVNLEQRIAELEGGAANAPARAAPKPRAKATAKAAPRTIEKRRAPAKTRAPAKKAAAAKKDDKAD